MGELILVDGKRSGDLAAELVAKDHKIISGVNEKSGGANEGFDPHELLEAALSACTIITVQMYAKRKNWALTSTEVRVKVESETPELTTISRQIKFVGELNADQLKRLAEIADKCPIHRLLHGRVEIQTQI